jgi:hypothetical protein
MNKAVNSTNARMKFAMGPAATLRGGHRGRARRGGGARGVGVAPKFHIAAERKQSETPAGAPAVDSREQLGAKAQGKRLDLDPAPAADRIMPEFVKEDYRAHHGDEGKDIPPHPIDKSQGLI